LFQWNITKKEARIPTPKKTRRPKPNRYPCFIGLAVSQKAMDAIVKVADEENVSLSSVCRKAVNEWLERKN